MVRRWLWWNVVLEIASIRRWLDRPHLERRYEAKFGRRPQLNPPKRLSEKVMWRMLYQYEPAYSRLADKIEARQFIAERVGEALLPTLYASGRTSGDLRLDALPAPCILKGSHVSGGVIVVRDPATLDVAAATAALDGVLRRNYYRIAREYHYKRILPRLLAEELLVHRDGRLPADYKFYVFHGAIEVLWV
ncbi:MAG: ATP-grasp fold amidoligase family protein, partial [Gemmatimonadota bacterium]|nr:ATP-grasp fold amidoligase family protein [Gemmatimonadota bacterium]